MKTRIPSIKIIAFALVIVSASLGAHFGSIIYHYEVIVRGILGIALIYLFIRVFWSSKVDAVEDYYVVLKNIKYFIYVFIGGIIIYWALIHIFEMVLYLKDLIF